MFMAMGRKHIIIYIITLVYLAIFISCNDSRNKALDANLQKTSIKNEIDSYVVKKGFSRANFIDSVVKKKRIRIAKYEYNTYQSTFCDCRIYSFYWGFLTSSKNILSIQLYFDANSSFTESQYYHDSRSYFYTDPDGNRIPVDYGLLLGYSYTQHAFTEPSKETSRHIYKKAKDMDIVIFDSIDIWDKRYDKGFFK